MLCRQISVGFSVVSIVGVVFYITTLQRSALIWSPDVATTEVPKHTITDRNEHQAAVQSITRTGDDVTPAMLKVRDKKKILLLTTRRSGSSFVGQLLNEHPDITYLFEPLQLIASNQSSAYVGTRLVNNHLKKMFSCAFTSVLRNDDQQPARKSLSHAECVTFLRHNQSAHDCSVEDIRRVERICKQPNKHVAIKVIRIYQRQLSLVENFMREQGLVVHLVRDPRGVVSSRITIEQIKAKRQRSEFIPANYDALVRKAKSHCKRVRDALVRISSWTAATPSFNQLYHLVRYEDFAYHPESMTSNLYYFIGMSVHKDVVSWLRKATRVDAGNKMYSTVRNSTRTAEAWRYKLPFYFVTAIQKLPDCQYVMHRLGYLVARSEPMLLDKSLSLITEI